MVMTTDVLVTDIYFIFNFFFKSSNKIAFNVYIVSQISTAQVETPSTSVVELLLVIQLAQCREYSVVQLPILSQSNSTFKFNRWPKRRPSNISHMSSLA